MSMSVRSVTSDFTVSGDYDAFGQTANTVEFVTDEGFTDGRQLAGAALFFVDHWKTCGQSFNGSILGTDSCIWRPSSTPAATAARSASSCPPDLAELTREERAILRQLLEWRLRNDAREEDQPGPDALDPAGSPPWRRGPPSR